MEIYFDKQVFIKWRVTLNVFKFIFYKPFIENKQHVHIMGNTNINARTLLYKVGQKRKKHHQQQHHQQQHHQQQQHNLYC